MNTFFRLTAKMTLATAFAAGLTSWASVAAAASPAGTPIVLAQAEKPSGQGTVNAVDAAARKVNMTHGPIAALKWQGMTMDFTVAPSVDLVALKPGAKVGFTLSRGANGMYVIDSMKPAE